MRISVELTGGQNLGARLQQAIAEISRQVVNRTTLEIQNEVKLNLQGKILKVGTGALLRGWSQAPRFEEQSGVYSGTLRSNAKYAAIHEYGGEITPKRAQNLTIPLRAAKTGAGLPRFRAWEVFQDPTSFGFKHVWINRQRTAILGVKPGKKAKPVGLFALRKSVTIPARHYVSDAIETVKAKLPDINEAVTLRVAQAMGLLRRS